MRSTECVTHLSRRMNHGIVPKSPDRARGAFLTARVSKGGGGKEQNKNGQTLKIFKLLTELCVTFSVGYDKMSLHLKPRDPSVWAFQISTQKWPDTCACKSHILSFHPIWILPTGKKPRDASHVTHALR